jgi:hypothetical protein
MYKLYNYHENISLKNHSDLIVSVLLVFIKKRGIYTINSAKKEIAMIGYICQFIQIVMIIGPKNDPN